jgi:prepilin-type N-terminal cleavage/methylation domain-containing protein
MRRLKNNSAHGFTLVELIVVIGIMSVLLTFSFPALNNLYRNWQLDLSANELRQCLLSLRTNSITERCRYKLVFESGSNGYSILKEDLDHEGDRLYISPVGKWGKTQYFSEGLTLVSNKPEITFYPDGTATPAEFTVGVNSLKLMMVLDGALGYAKIQNQEEL